MSQVWILLVVVWYQALEAKRQLRMEETLEVLQHFGENKRLLLRLLMQRPCSRQQYIKKHLAGQYPLHFAPAWFMAKHASQTWGCDRWVHNKHSFDTNAAASERHNLKGKASKPRPPSYTLCSVRYAILVPQKTALTENCIKWYILWISTKIIDQTQHLSKGKNRLNRNCNKQNKV